MPVNPSPRASPDALLALASKAGRGRLKIFLGAAPGVGKTYAMLSAARAAMADGVDVVAGLVETHGRKETEALVSGLEILPRAPIVYRNQMLKEFDLDAALARKPSLLLVDEYAHTNVPGSRHPKRWQDIDELLDAGIDVWTTLNIQHLEGLNDVVQKITKVRVRETVPDPVFDKADELVLVDFPPDELLKRLSEGKIYVQETATRAVESFFKPQNLAALRELALRRAAERIDADLVSRMQANAIEGPWAAGERIAACVGADGAAESIVRAAKRLADLMDAPWIVLTVERAGEVLGDDRRKAIDGALSLARTLGGETKTLFGSDLPDEILKFCRFENVTQIVVGRPQASLFAQLTRRSLAHEIIRRANDIGVHVVTGTASPPRKARIPYALPKPRDIGAFATAALAVAVAVMAGRMISSVTPLPNLSMIFLVAVLVIAVSFGIWPAIFASALSFLAYNFFFIEPRYSFTVAEPYELLALVTFLAVAVVTSTLAGRVKSQIRIAADRTRATRRLYEFTRRLSTLANVDDIAEGAVSEIHSSLGYPAILLLKGDAGLRIAASWPPEDDLDPASMSAAQWACDHDEPAGYKTSTLPMIEWYFVSLRSVHRSLGAVGIAIKNQRGLDSETQALFETLAEQASASIERARLSDSMIVAESAVQEERIRNTVLASISHDFRTPLSSILGSSTSLLEYGDKLSVEARTDLLSHIKDEAVHLDEMVRNLLAMTRIDAGALELRKDWIDLNEIADRVVNAAKRRGVKHSLVVKHASPSPLVLGDAMLAEQALGNLVGNAIKHTPERTPIVVSTAHQSDKSLLTVEDDGPGIPGDILPRVFDKFVSARRNDELSNNKGEGTGLGLAIARGIMRAHGGEVFAISPTASGRGTRLTMEFPTPETQR